MLKAQSHRIIRSIVSSSLTSTTSIPLIQQKRNIGLFEASIGLASVAAGAGAFFNARYRVSRPDQYLIRTGLFIKDINVSKQGLQLPFQYYNFMDMQPRNYSFQLHSMSSEKMEFLLPGTFTIGPKNDPVALQNYARTLMNIIPNGGSEVDQNKSSTLDSLIKGILEGEVRILSAGMTIEQIFNDRKAFKDTIVKNVQEELDQFGLAIFNSNIRELQDTPGSEYFSFIRQKKRSEAENRAKIDVAEAKKVGDIGEKERQAITRQKVAQFESETVIKENERRQEIEKSNANLEVVKMEAFRLRELARIEAENIARMRDIEMNRSIEQARISTETEKMRAKEMSNTQVKAEMEIKEAEGESSALRIKSEAQLYAKQLEAQGVLAMFDAQSSGLLKLMGTFGDNKDALLQYLMIDRHVYERIAETNAKAIHNMQPKITVWNTTGGTTSPSSSKGDSSSSSYTNTIADLFKMLPPMLDTIYDQTGIRPSSHLVEMKDKKKEVTPITTSSA